MTLRRAVVAGTIALLLAVAASGAARADEAYTVDGSDVFKVGGGTTASKTVYHGTQSLAIRKTATGTTYVARVSYDKDGEGGKGHARASYTTTLLPSGDQHDGPSHDPDYLTVLNQPFAVQLDAGTMRDLANVKRPVPFAFPSPMTGAPLRGTLSRLPDGMINGVRVMGIAFDATGPLNGALPDRPEMALAGAITMKGTAYYAYANALLLALDATLAIDGNLDNSAKKATVSIVYSRTIRSAANQETARLTPSPKKT